MPIREDAVTRHGNNLSEVSEFTQSQHDIDPGQTCSDESNRRVGMQPFVGFRRPCIVVIQTRIGRGPRDSRKRSWIEVSGCQNDQGVLQTDINDCCDFLFERARRCQERLDVPPKYRSWSKGFLRCSRVMILAKPVQEVIWLIGQCADLPCGNIQHVAEARS